MAVSISGGCKNVADTVGYIVSLTRKRFMRKFTVIASGLLLGLGIVAWKTAIAADAPKAADEAAERAKFVGVWKGYAVEGKGENPNRGPVKLEITATDKTMHGIQIKSDGNVDHGVGEFTFDLAAEPRRLDAAKTNERGRKQEYIGIYALEGDTLKWCVSPQKVRPETFETKKGQFLVILKRDKTAAK